MKTFYITTPIYYVNGDPHVGTIYTTLAADVLSRYKKLNNIKVFFLTGTDEHGEKAELAAKKAGMKTKEFVDKMAPRFKKAFKAMNVDYDRFIRTTDKDHLKEVEYFYKQVYKKGDIYKGFYEGLYCVPCETFWTEKELINGSCPTCNREVKKLKEETLFFKQSKYQNNIIKHIKNNPDFIQPETRQNEILSFLKQPLRDVSISRTTFKWGVPVPDEPNHVLYVWFDALTNYLTGAGYPKKDYKTTWPADVHFVGKDIIRFHCVTWPAMLLSAGLKLPKTIFANGFYTSEGEKMSKSKGNVVHPAEFCKKHEVPIDTIRYFLFRQMPFGSDGDFSEAQFVERVNNELASELGNLLSRSLALIEKYNNGNVKEGKISNELKNDYNKILKKYHDCMKKIDYYNSLNHTFKFIHFVNKYIAEKEPWKIKDKNELNNVLYNLAQSINAISCLIYPFMPETSKEMDKQLGVEKNYNENFNNVRGGVKVKRGRILFPRIEEAE